MKFHHVIVGGTFDHFHRGHQKLLTQSFKVGEKITVGISLPQLYQNKKHTLSVEGYSIREQYVTDFVNKHHQLEKTTIIPISTIYGTTLEDPSIEAIIVSPDTKKTAEIINVKRRASKLSPMEIIVVPFEKGDDGKIISSERIRQGLIDRQGKSYQLFLNIHDQYILPDSLRDELKKPSGDIYLSKESIKHFFQKTVITVGDIVSSYCITYGFSPKVAIVDFKTQRSDVGPEIKNLFHPTAQLANQAGTINSAFGNIFLDLLQKKSPQTLLVEGEEDLLTLPVILLSPLESIILYGQKDLGMIAVIVTEEKKQFAKELLSRLRHG